MKTEDSADFLCPWCLQENEVWVELPAGSDQTFTQDCAVCCRPVVIHCTVVKETGELAVDVEQES